MFEEQASTYLVAERYAVVWLMRRVPVSEVRRAAEQARLAGRPDVAADLEKYAAQLRRMTGSISANENAETVPAEIATGSERPTSLGPLTADAAAGRLGVSASRVRQWLRDGTLSGSQSGGRWTVDRRSVEDLKRMRSM